MMYIREIAHFLHVMSTTACITLTNRQAVLQPCREAVSFQPVSVVNIFAHVTNTSDWSE